jgi:phosphoglycolate phosphatase-like HAD superfamily hydrolase
MNLSALSDLASATTPLAIAADPADYRRHFVHGPDRMWPETNCYFDLWIETLHCLGMDPVPSFACLLSADHDGMQWTFVKQPPDDLRRLYGLEVAEAGLWLPILETIESGAARGVLHTVEVDSWWLPDTLGTAYLTEHVKTTIVPTRVDRNGRVLHYLHNAGLFELGGDDFDGVFGLTEQSAVVLPPYVEQVRHHPDQVEQDAVVRLVREHLKRRPRGNPAARLVAGVEHAMEWLPTSGMERFHLWAFATLRQCGATAELVADLAEHVDDVFAGAGDAAEHFRTAAANAKSVQFKMARVARGRAVDVGDTLASMASSWQSGMDAIAAAVD